MHIRCVVISIPVGVAVGATEGTDVGVTVGAGVGVALGADVGSAAHAQAHLLLLLHPASLSLCGLNLSLPLLVR